MKVRLPFVCICVFSVFISLTGCSRQEEKQKAEIGNSQTNKSARVQGKSWKLLSLSNESVLMRCGTNELTKGEMDRVIDLRVKMLKNPKAALIMENLKWFKDNEIPLKNRFWGLKEILNL